MSDALFDFKYSDPLKFREMIPGLRNPKLVGKPQFLVSNFDPGIKKMHITFDDGGRVPDVGLQGSAN